MLHAAKAYRETQVTTTSPGQVLILLYDGALNYLARAKESIAAKDVKSKGILISKALDVINELASSLNAEKGGSLADNLKHLYFFCSKRLFMANLKMDTTMVDEVMNILSGLRSAYAQILDSPEAVAAAAQVEATRKAAPQAQGGSISMRDAAPIMSAAAQEARMRGAYAQQAGQGAPNQEPVSVSAQGMSEQPDDMAAAPPETVQAIAAQGAPEAVPVLETDDLMPEHRAKSAPTPPPGLLGANRRLAVSALYRKFSS